MKSLRVAIIGADQERLREVARAVGDVPEVNVVTRSWPLGRYRSLGRPDVVVGVVDMAESTQDLQLIASIAGRCRLIVLGRPNLRDGGEFVRLLGAAAYYVDIEAMADALRFESKAPTQSRPVKGILLRFVPEFAVLIGIAAQLAIPMSADDRTGAAGIGVALACIATWWSLRRQEKDLPLLFDAVKELTRQCEHVRYSRMLHDHVLQTLEMLSRSESALDSMARALVVRDARWLRALLESGFPPADGEAAEALASLVTEYDDGPLRVTMTAAQHEWPALSQKSVTALCGAAREALQNIRKHARTGTAEVVAKPRSDGVELRIRDRGIGFDPARTRNGFGLTESITNRLREVGGLAHVDSASGAGTSVRLFVPSS